MTNLPESVVNQIQDDIRLLESLQTVVFRFCVDPATGRVTQETIRLNELIRDAIKMRGKRAFDEQERARIG